MEGHVFQSVTCILAYLLLLDGRVCMVTGESAVCGKEDVSFVLLVFAMSQCPLVLGAVVEFLFSRMFGHWSVPLRGTCLLPLALRVRYPVL